MYTVGGTPNESRNAVQFVLIQDRPARNKLYRITYQSEARIVDRSGVFYFYHFDDENNLDAQLISFSGLAFTPLGSHPKA